MKRFYIAGLVLAAINIGMALTPLNLSAVLGWFVTALLFGSMLARLDGE